MSQLRIDGGLCTGCGLCGSSCPQGALRIREGIPRADMESCTLCGVCADTCPQGAISTGPAARGSAVTGHRGVWVFIEQMGGSPLPVALELLSKGRELADNLAEPLCAVLLGGGMAAELAAGYGPDRLYCFTVNDGQNELELTQALAHLIEKEHPAILLFGATQLGRSLAPRLASRVKTGLTADCTGLEIDPETRLLEQTRPAFGGNLMATIVCPERRPQMATVRPGVFPARPCRREAVIIPVRQAGEAQIPRLVRVLAEEAGEAQKSIAHAPLILSVGRGIGHQKNLKLAEELAARLGAQIGASRPLVEAGWLPYRHQIGQTGCSVAPRLLLAFGISGAVQHIAGIGGAKRIVAINSDPDAPIFEVAHDCVVGDCGEILVEMLEQTKAL